MVLASIREPTGLLRRLLDGGNSSIAGRLVGAFRRVSRSDMAEEIRAASGPARGYIRPRAYRSAAAGQASDNDSAAAPIVGRIQSMWESMRGTVLNTFPPPPGPTLDRAAYLHFVDEIYQSDAYHSLSIEGYRVTLDLIERVRSENWRPESNEARIKESRCFCRTGDTGKRLQLVSAPVKKSPSGANLMHSPFHAGIGIGALPAIRRRRTDSSHRSRRLINESRFGSSCAHRVTRLPAGRLCGTRCPHSLIFSNPNRSPPFEPS